jgi:hypothetical protein
MAGNKPGPRSRIEGPKHAPETVSGQPDTAYWNRVPSWLIQLQADGTITAGELAYVLQVFDLVRNRPGYFVRWRFEETARRTGIPRNRLTAARRKLADLELLDVFVERGSRLPAEISVGPRLWADAGHLRPTRPRHSVRSQEQS